jgi:hypothetical protein
MIEMADRYSPRKMREAGYFIQVGSDVLPKKGNQFFRLSATSSEIGVIATSSAALAIVKSSSAAVELMLYKECWEDENYYKPRRKLLRKLEK